ncbi:hypothetical protein EVAR_91716_1 [Eumeta japonica]|uniref:Uncharacterized protein n=1 Tax=Eumeta variegata TaxID=151549 RepID=A0A4C1ZBK8_EUMVA|nr:hypothetical protein EVAR_91716_1 [Eumeta japonica]
MDCVANCQWETGTNVQFKSQQSNSNAELLHSNVYLHLIYALVSNGFRSKFLGDGTVIAANCAGGQSQSEQRQPRIARLGSCRWRKEPRVTFTSSPQKLPRTASDYERGKAIALKRA